MRQDLFSGDLALKKLVGTYDVQLTAEEQSFLDNETEVLCEMLDQHQIEIDQNLPPEVWDYIREKKFMGMVMPKKFGGLGFSGGLHVLNCTWLAAGLSCDGQGKTERERVLAEPFHGARLYPRRLGPQSRNQSAQLGQPL